MPNHTQKQQKEKVVGLKLDNGKENISVTHVTIRQSIFFLVSRLIIIELAVSISMVAVYLGVNASLSILIYLLLIFSKTSLMIFVIFQWLEEYYEITPSSVIHKKGFIIKSEDEQALNHLGALELDQGIFGRLFNYGTLRLYNWALEKNFSLYLIHNPQKYHKILKRLLPEVDKQKHMVREHIIETERE